jgi:hypothetical protein
MFSVKLLIRNSSMMCFMGLFILHFPCLFYRFTIISKNNQQPMQNMKTISSLMKVSQFIGLRTFLSAIQPASVMSCQLGLL